MANADYAPGGLYRAPIVLWVEDVLTRAYLSTLWNDARFQYLVAGGNEGVRVMVDSARVEGFLNVFGVVDRDDGTSNVERWAAPDGPPSVCRLPVHEIENYLLDGESLARSRYNNREPQCSADDIERFMKGKAVGLLWYTACRQTLNEIKIRFQADFPGKPPQDLASRDAALRRVCNTSWYRNLKANAEGTSPEKIDDLLKKWGERCEKSLGDKRWKSDFTAKEILADAVSRFCDRPRMTDPTDSAAVYTDIAQDVAERQRDESRMDPDLAALKDAFANWLKRNG